MDRCGRSLAVGAEHYVSRPESATVKCRTLREGRKYRPDCANTTTGQGKY
jgi:hypothetical protein